MTQSADTSDFTLTCDRFWGLRNSGRKIPSSGSPTVADALIT